MIDKTASQFGAFLLSLQSQKRLVMYATYIKKEVADLNGTGATQACYKIKLTPMDFDHFVGLCQREGGWDESITIQEIFWSIGRMKMFEKGWIWHSQVLLPL